MIGFLTYLPTIVFMPHFLYVLILAFILLKYNSKVKLGNPTNMFVVLLIITLSALNNLMHPSLFKQATDYIPFLVFMIISVITAQHFKKRDAQILIFFITIECLVVITESYLGISTFFKSIPTYLEYGKSGLLYSNRPFGLSTNSSVIALKIFVALVLINYYKLKGKIVYLSTFILFIACILTFNRTVIVALTFFYTLLIVTKFYTIKLSHSQIFLIFGLLFSIATIFFFYSEEISSVVVKQFTRNKGKVELTGRTVIWQHFIEFIKQNFFLGNGSFKYHVEPFFNGKTFHAHNSFLQVLATHGFVIFLLYIFLIIKNITKHNYIYVLSFMVYSMSQYGIFWGVSLTDIIFFVFLFNTYNKSSIPINVSKPLKNLTYG